MVQSKILFERLTELKQKVMSVVLMGIIIMSLLAWVLSKLFMRPIHQHIKQIEDFIHDTTHELNTPITALSMSVSRALKKQVFDEKILKNISISTKQLFDIYSSLTYLNFDSKVHTDKEVSIDKVLEKSVEYYKELSQSKKIDIHLNISPCRFKIDETKLTMLFGNLINNAIKYSMPNSVIDIRLKEGVFSIQDYGIGIEEEKIEHIFRKFNRETEYAGGFGIGLSIVKKICEAYSIKLEVSSQKSVGTLFTLTFL
jgi:two-component system OmpR family sensor kinase